MYECLAMVVVFIIGWIVYEEDRKAHRQPLRHVAIERRTPKPKTLQKWAKLARQHQKRHKPKFVSAVEQREQQSKEPELPQRQPDLQGFVDSRLVLDYPARAPTEEEIDIARQKYKWTIRSDMDWSIPIGNSIAWKACRTELNDRVDVELFVPCNAKRVCIPEEHWKKSRVSMAYVLSITSRDGWPTYHYANSFVAGNTLRYWMRQWVFPDSFDSDPSITCGHGINVHQTREQCSIWG